MFKVSRVASFVGGLGVVLSAGPASAYRATPPCTVTAVHAATVAMAHPQVVPIFWGGAWSTQIPGRNTILGQVQNTLNGPYQSLLNQYRAGSDGLRPAPMATVGPLYTATNPSPSFTEQSLVNVITSLMDSGAIPQANSQIEYLYVVFTPSGARDTNAAGANGVHRTASHGGNSFPWAWVGDPSSVNAYSTVFGRELTGTITNPTGSGVKLDTSNCGNGLEIADVCPGVTNPQEGFTLQAYYSAADKTCAVPDSYTAIWRYNNSPNNWTSISSNLKQAYASDAPPGQNPIIVATDVLGQVWSYTGSPPSWGSGPIGGVGCAMLATAGGNIFCLQQNTNNLFQWAGGTNWTQFATPSGTTGTGIYGGGPNLVFTDTQGKVSTYSTSSHGWTTVSSTVFANQVVSNYNSLYFVARNTSLYRYQTNSGLTQISASGAPEIITGGGINDLAAIPMVAIAGGPFWDGVQSYTFSGGFTLLSNPFTGLDDFAIGGGGLFALSGDHSTIAQSNNPSDLTAGWTHIGGPSPRLIPQGNTLYALGAVAF